MNSKRRFLQNNITKNDNVKNLHEKPSTKTTISTVGKFDSETQDEDIDNENDGKMEETSYKIMSEIILPLLFAGFGMVLAGILLDNIKTSKVFQNIPEIYILLPALLGLKGNLEMTMTSRLSSLANCGKLSNPEESYRIFKSNLALVQVQSIVIGLAAAIFAIMVNIVISPVNVFNSSTEFDFIGFFQHCLIDKIPILTVTSILTALLTSFLLGLIMTKVIKYATRHGINPDNIATPIAASLGDLVTLIILYTISSMLYFSKEYFAMSNRLWVLHATWIIVASLKWAIHLVINFVKHPSTRQALKANCWIPMLAAMLISSLSGCILSFTVRRFKQISAYQPLVNGVGGNIAAIQASRLSSFVHQRNQKQPNSSSLQNDDNIKNQFDVHSLSARTLLSLVIPFHLIFYLLMIHLSQTWAGFLFLVYYLISTLLQVYILLWLTGWLTWKIWKSGHDPDNQTIPYLTAIGDLLGTIFLTAAFYSYEYTIVQY